MNKHTAEKPLKISRPLLDILSYLGYIAVGVVLALLLRAFVVCPVRVVGWSMEPTLYENDIMVITPSSYKMHDVERFDVIVVKRPHADNVLLVKRIIGLPGETVSIRDGAVYINGELLDTDVYGAQPMDYTMEETQIPEGYVFVLGDNRNQSTDSHELGSIPIADIRGKVQCSLIPYRNVYER